MTWEVQHGDMAQRLASLESSSVDCVVTDPPYGLNKPPDMAKVLRGWLDVGDAPISGHGFMAAEWDAFVPPPRAWLKVWRVLKPGGMLLSFAAARTMDVMGLSLRLAGFDLVGGLSVRGGIYRVELADEFLGCATPKAGWWDLDVAGDIVERVELTGIESDGA